MTQSVEVFMEQHEGCIVSPVIVEQMRIQVDHIDFQTAVFVAAPACHTVALRGV